MSIESLETLQEMGMCDGRRSAVDIPEKANSLTPLETVERALLLFVDCVHPLFQLRPSGLGFPPGIPFFFDGLKRKPGRVAFLAEGIELVLVLPRLLLPCLHVRLDFLALGLQVSKCLLEGGGKLLLGVEMLLNRTDSGFLVLNDLSTDKLFAGMPRARR